jgi:hypothetical protein
MSKNIKKPRACCNRCFSTARDYAESRDIEMNLGCHKKCLHLDTSTSGRHCNFPDCRFCNKWNNMSITNFNSVYEIFEDCLSTKVPSVGEYPHYRLNFGKMVPHKLQLCHINVDLLPFVLHSLFEKNVEEFIRLNYNIDNMKHFVKESLFKPKHEHQDGHRRLQLKYLIQKIRLKMIEDLIRILRLFTISDLVSTITQYASQEDKLFDWLIKCVNSTFKNSHFERIIFS